MPAALLFGTTVLVASCTPPPPPVVVSCPEPVWREYTDFKPYQVTNEMERLEKLLQEHDSSSVLSGKRDDSTTDTSPLSELAIKQRLFELSIHRANPDFNADEIYTYLTFCYQHGGPDSLRYLNWGRVIREYRAVLQEQDSLERSIAGFSKEKSRKNGRVRRLVQEKRDCIRKQDSLKTIINQQKETIQKLQKLDVLMEEQRSKIQ